MFTRIRQQRVKPSYQRMRFPDRGLSRYERSERCAAWCLVFTLCAFVVIAAGGLIRIL